MGQKNLQRSVTKSLEKITSKSEDPDKGAASFLRPLAAFPLHLTINKVTGICSTYGTGSHPRKITSFIMETLKTI
jgi:hypothetical protein